MHDRVQVSTHIVMAGCAPAIHAGQAQGITIEGLRHNYWQQGKPVLAVRDVNLDIPAHTFVSIVGASGCGKTTLLDILSGLAAAQEGTVLVGGQAPQAGRKDCARMFARDALLPWRSALRNVDFALATRLIGKTERYQRASHLLDEVGLGAFKEAYPRQLSQGMRQRVALARTFAMQSPFIFLDEPFGALDALTKINLQDLLLRLWGESRATVVLVTHDLGEAVALSDRVIVMSSRPGTIVADVTIDLPRPRDVRSLQTLPRFHALVADLWGRL